MYSNTSRYLRNFILGNTSPNIKGSFSIITRGKTDEINHSHYYPNTSVGIKERSLKPDSPPEDPLQTPYPPFKDGKNPKTGEVGGPSGPEPTRFGDWERKGRVTDF